MTTSKEEVKILLEGSGKVTIDWGDGYVILDSNLSSTYTSTYTCNHIYSDSSDHTITIIGKNVKSLYCYNNQLTSLDISKNIKLQYLNCSENQLISLNVSKNIALTGLNCADNQLKSLDVRKNTKLKNLFCGNNQLTDLNLNKNIKLFSLECQNNNFSETALNEMFESLHNVSFRDKRIHRIYMFRNKRLYSPMFENKKSVNIIGNPGTEHCDKTIAEKKGWKVIDKKN
jgi:hypothetical protein